MPKPPGTSSSWGLRYVQAPPLVLINTAERCPLGAMGQHGEVRGGVLTLELRDLARFPAPAHGCMLFPVP